MATQISLFLLTSMQAVALVALVVASAFTQEGGAVAYTVTDLGPLSGGESDAAGINEVGQVMGEFDAGPPRSFHGFLCSAGTRTDLGILDSSRTFTAARGIEKRPWFFEA